MHKVSDHVMAPETYHPKSHYQYSLFRYTGVIRIPCISPDYSHFPRESLKFTERSVYVVDLKLFCDLF